MKNFLFLLFICLSFKIFSQDLNDKIFPKEADSIICKITSIQKNWLYYDHQEKKYIKNDYIHISDIRYYLYNGIKTTAIEHKSKFIISNTLISATSISEKNNIMNSSPKDTIQTFYLDTIKTFYLDTLGKKHACLILLSKSKIIKQANQLIKIQLVDSLGNIAILLPNQISGYWINGVFYKIFKTIYNGKNVAFFAEELITGKASLYVYNGERLNNESIYIFKKQSETEYYFVQEKITTKEHTATSNTVQNSDGSASSIELLEFHDETPYLNFFQSYFSDCSEITLKFKSSWYTYNDITAAFRDYNKCR